MDLHSPVIFNITDGRGAPTQNGNIVNIPMLAKKVDIENTILPYLRSGQFDYGVVNYDASIADRTPIKLSNANRVTNTIANSILFGDNGQFKGKLPLFNVHNNKAYLLNPVGNEGASVNLEDHVIDHKMSTFTDESWGAHQAKVYDKFKHIFGLTDGNYGAKTNHKAELESPKRGLNGAATNKYGMFSWKAYQAVSPGLIDDDLVGMRGFNMRAHDYNLYMNGQLVMSGAESIKTVGSGIVLPMKDAYGHMSNFQLSTDLTQNKVGLKFRAADGKTVSQGAFSTKEQYGRSYHFKNTAGVDVGFKVKKATNEEILFEDMYGEFKCSPKQELVEFLRARNYDLPEIVTSVKPEPNGKYVWPAPGSLANNTSSPSRAGFIHVNQPRNGQTGNVVLVVEGALKGIIVAEYLNRKDRMGVSLADKLAGDLGIIIAQVPGVSDAYIQSIDSILETKNVHGVLIAMDADGRENLNVCEGIHNAYNKFSQAGLPTHVISWDPKHKGLDDAMLAISRNELTYNDMGIQNGSAEALFPLENASRPITYDVNGNVINSKEPSWQQEWSDTKGAAALANMKAQGPLDVFTAAVVGGESQPIVEKPAQPVTGIMGQPVVDSTQPVVDSTQPVVDSTQSVVNMNVPPVQSVVNNAQPVDINVQPAVNTVQSVVETDVQPVVNTTQPVQPVTEAAQTKLPQQTVQVSEQDVEQIIENNKKRFENDEEFLRDIKSIGDAAKHLSQLTESFVSKYS